MLTTRPTLGKYLVGMGASLLIFLAGGWLILAPFALGYQPYGADWVNQTTAEKIMEWAEVPTLVELRQLETPDLCHYELCAIEA